MRVFVDTSAWHALFDRREVNHADAYRIWSRIVKARAALVTSEYVFDELVTNLLYRVGHRLAVRAGETILRSPHVQVVDVPRERFDQAWAMFQRYEDKGFSFTDVTSFVLITECACDAVFAFDRHFEQAGFRLLTAA